MKIAIIIPTYNRPLMVRRVLRSLADCELFDDIEIIVVENGSKSGIDKECSANNLNGRVRYIHVEKAGRSNALNVGIKSTTADFIIFFDDDLTFPSKTISAYSSAAKKYGPRHFFGGPLKADSETSCPPHLIPFLPPSSVDWSLGNEEIFIDRSYSDLFFGANWGGFKKDFEETGLFSAELGVSASRLSPLGEETSLQQKFLDAGLKGVYLPAALINHFVQKECYTSHWIRNRKMRHGVTDYLMHIKDDKNVRKIFGVPTWTVREIFERYCNYIAAFVFFKSLERKTNLSMRISYLKGILVGALNNSANKMEKSDSSIFRFFKT